MHPFARTFFVAVLLLPVLTRAQTPRRLSLQIDAGAARGRTSGPYLSEGGMSAAAVIGLDAGSSLIVGIAGSAMPMGVATASCDAVPGVPCPDDFPTFWTASALIGWRSGSGTLRLLAGPGVASADSRRAGVVHARIEVSTHVASRASLLIAPAIIYVPDFRGSSVTLLSVGAGVRLQ
jgi:hypothetical protein